MTEKRMHRVYAYVWEYRVDPAWRDRFAAAYGADGVWADFFGQSEGYLRTDLHCDAVDADRFLTIDYFKDPSWRADLVAAQAERFDRIDREWEQATLSETKIGEFWVETA